MFCIFFAALLFFISINSEKKRRKMLQALTGLQFQLKEQLGEKKRGLQFTQETRAQHTQFHMQFSYKPMFQRLFPVRPEISSSQLSSIPKVYICIHIEP